MIKKMIKQALCVILTAALFLPSFFYEIKAAELEIAEGYIEENIKDDIIEDDIEDNTEEILEETDDSENMELADDRPEDFEFHPGYIAPIDDIDFESYSGDEMSIASLEECYIPTNLPLTRNQNPYGTCWAHSAIALTEMAMGGNPIDYSELQLAYFSYHPVKDPLGGLDGDSNGVPDEDFASYGGATEYAAVVLANWVGATEESLVPYTDIVTSRYSKDVNKVKAYNLDDEYAFGKDVAHVQGYYKVDPKTDRDAAKQLIKKYGGLGVSYHAVTAGTYNGYSYSQIYNDSTKAYYLPVVSKTNHAVTAVGWDDNFKKENFGVEPEGDGAWLIRNSWQDGKTVSHRSEYTYFWLSYYDKSLSDSAVAFEAEPADNYDNNYQYDGSMLSSSVYSSYSKVANMFEAKADPNGETLEAISFATSYADTSYTIKIYTDCQSGNPESGTLALTQDGLTTYSGYYTVLLSNPISLDYGQSFSIVLSSDKTRPFVVDYSYNGVYVCTSHVDENTSLYYSTNSKSWVDCKSMNYGNLRIKAFTNNNADSPSNKVKVSFNTDGGSSISTISVTPGSEYGTLPTPTKDYYDFLGWYNQKTGGAQVTSSTIVTSDADHTLYAHWKKHTYQVWLDACGGSCDRATKSVTYADTFGTLPTPTRAGYTFTGWYTKKTGGTMVTSSTVVNTSTFNFTANMSYLYAQWSAKSYTVSFDSNGAGTNISPINVTYDQTYGALPTPTRAGYTFDGWYTAKTGGSKVVSTTKVTIDDNHCLYARWIGKPITVTFIANGGTCTQTKKTVNVSGEYGVLPVATHANKDFAGWFDSIDDGNEIKSDTEVTITNNHNLYAHWNLRKMNAPASVPESGSTVTFNDKIRIVSAYSGAKIYYTYNGAEPVPGDIDVYLYDQSYIKVTKDKIVNNQLTIKAKAVYEDEFISSDVAEFTFDFVDDSDIGDITPEDAQELKDKYGDDKPLVEIIPDGLWIAGLGKYEYTGSAIKPDIRIYDGKTLLSPKTDYSLSYKNNVNVAESDARNVKGVSIAPTITVSSKGNYSGKETVCFEIYKKSIDDAVISEPGTVLYNKREQKPVPTITIGKKKLAVNKDYVVEYRNEAGNICTPKDPGEYSVVLTAIGNYEGSATKDFVIGEGTQVLVSKLKVKTTNKVYSGNTITLDETELVVSEGKKELILNKDYTVSYADNKEIGNASLTITGKGERYIGSTTVTFKITGNAMSSVKVDNDSFVKSYLYDGTSKDQSGLLLSYTPNGETVEWATDSEYAAMNESQKADVDCVVSYSNNVNAGTATMLLTGVNGFTGTVKKTYKINAYDISQTGDAEDRIDVNLGTQEFEYNKSGVKPNATVTFKKGDGNTITLTNGVDYTVSYVNNSAVNLGENLKKLPCVKITGKGNFKNSNTEAAFLILPASLQSDAQGIKIDVKDKIYSSSAGNWKSNIAVVDNNNKKLAANSDYNPTIVYTYDYLPTGLEVMDGASKLKVKPAINREIGDEVGEKDIVPAGTVIKVTVTGSGKNYKSTDSISTTYRIAASDINKLSASIPNFIYTGREIIISKDDISWKSGINVLSDVTFDIVGYSNNVKKGRATVIVRGTGNYGGTKSITYNIGTKTFLWWTF